MRKLIDACALFAAATCVGFIGTGVFLYFQRDAITQQIEGQIKEAILGAIDIPLPGIGSGDAAGSLPSGGLPAAPGLPRF